MPQNTDDILTKIFIREGLGSQGGFKPHVLDKVLSDMRSQQLDRFHTDLIRSDRRADHLSTLLGLEGGNSRQMVGALINSRQLSEAFGGSRLAMFSNTQTGLSNAGLLRTAEGGVVAAGYNGMTMDISKDLMESVEKRFFPTATGAADRDLTRGFSRNDISGVFARLSANGALRGMGEVLGENAKGEIRFTEDAKGQVNAMMETSMRTMEVFKDFMGDVGIDELMRGVDAAIGKAAGSENDMRAAMSRVNELKRHAQSAGGSLDTWFGVYRTVAENLASVGFGGEAGASAAANITRSAANVRGFLPPGMETAAAAGFAMDQEAFNTESPEVAALIYAASMPNVSTEDRAGLMGLLEKAAQSEDIGGFDSGMGAAAAFARSKGMMGLDAVMRITGNDPRAKLRGADADKLGDLAATQFQARRRPKVEQTMREMMAGGADDDAISEVLDARLSMDPGEYAKHVEGLTGSRKHAAEILERLGSDDPDLAALVSAGQTRRMEEVNKTMALGRIQLGGRDPAATGTFLVGVVDGLLSTPNPGTDVLGEYLFQTNGEGKLELLTEIETMSSTDLEDMDSKFGLFSRDGKVYKFKDREDVKKDFMADRDRAMRGFLGLGSDLPPGGTGIEGEAVAREELKKDKALKARLDLVGADTLVDWFDADEKERINLLGKAKADAEAEPGKLDFFTGKSRKAKERLGQLQTLEFLDNLGGDGKAALVRKLEDEESELTKKGDSEENVAKQKALREQRQALQEQLRRDSGLASKGKGPDDFYVLLERILLALDNTDKDFGGKK